MLDFLKIKKHVDPKREALENVVDLIDKAREKSEQKISELNIISKDMDERIKDLVSKEDYYNKKVKDQEIIADRLKKEAEYIISQREIIDREQRYLWEKFDVLKDALNVEKMWTELWGCAFSKAFDICWDLMKKTTIDTIEKVKLETSKEVEKRIVDIYSRKIESLIEKKNENVDMMRLSIAKENAHNQFLIAERTKNSEVKTFYKGQLDLIKELTNEN